MFFSRSEIFLFVVFSLKFVHGQIESRPHLGAFCGNDTSHGDPNLNPIDEGRVLFLRSVENGSLYTVGSDEDQFFLLHLWGHTGYDFGFAYGTLLKEQIGQLLPRAWAHFEQRVMKELDKLKLPKWFEDIVANQGLAVALDFQNALVERFVDREIYEEMRGIADAASVSYAQIRRIHMLGEITRGIRLFCIRFSIDSSLVRFRSMFALRALGQRDARRQNSATARLGLGHARRSARFPRGDHLPPVVGQTRTSVRQLGLGGLHRHADGRLLEPVGNIGDRNLFFR